MKLLTKISEMVSSNVGILIVIFAIMALKFPAGFIWADAGQPLGGPAFVALLSSARRRG